MRKLLTLFLLAGCSFSSAIAQVKSPSEFLGYELGSKFTYHFKVADYFRQTAQQSPNKVKLIEYGKTNEGRPLMVAVVSSPENIAKLEQIRQNNLALVNGKGGQVDIKSQPNIVWLSYNVHGNEANSTETSMKMFHTLVTGSDQRVDNWLKNTVVVIDPCLNPDGRDRYANYFNSVVGKVPNPDPSSREHNEPWPGGRPNHYYFDLNRDWAWQTQIESQQRVALYNKWMPQIHVDFHEQGYNEPYYFAPAAEPLHQNITSFQKDFQVEIGKNHAKYFDAEGWNYFTKERFDLLYPSYGDTYPMYNGAIGMTYEKGGIRAGLAVKTNDGSILTLKDRIEQHFTTGMSTVEIASLHHDKLLGEFKNYFSKLLTNAPGTYKTYIVKPTDLSRLKKLVELLKKNNIEYAFGGDKTGKGYEYDSQKEETFTIGRNDLIVNVLQPKGVLIDVMFEPKTVVTDSNTYDITAWAMPYAYGLKAYASKESIKGKYDSLEEPAVAKSTVEKPLAWVFNWGSAEDVQLLVALQDAKIRVRQSTQSFSFGTKEFPAGSLIVVRKENEEAVKDLGKKVLEVANKYNRPVFTTNTGYVDKGKDFGSNVYPFTSAPKIAVVAGQEASSLNFGEIRFFLEHDLGLMINYIAARDINNLDINTVNTLILPEGRYESFIGAGLSEWIKKGGKLILIESAIESFINKKDFEIKRKVQVAKTDDKKIEKSEPKRTLYKDRRNNKENEIPGAVYRVNLDPTHPLSFGLGKAYYALKTDDLIYDLGDKGWNIGTLNNQSFLAGVAGDKVKETLNSGTLIGVQNMGRGSVVYLGTNPLFRNFWESGKTLFSNVVFNNY